MSGCSVMRVVFMGTPAFAVPTLEALHEAGHDIVSRYTQPPRPAGRGKQLQRSPVHQAADALGSAVPHPATLRDMAADAACLPRAPALAAAAACGLIPRQPRTLRGMDAHADSLALGPDAAVVVAAGLVLPRALLQGATRRCFKVHGSLPPRWRGAAPIQRALVAGGQVTGVTTMRME